MVENDSVLMMAMVDFVEKAGCEAVEVHTVADAIAVLETGTDIRTVFTDLDMHASTAGMQLAASVRDRWPPIELVLISWQPWGEDAIPACSALFGKPFDGRHIISAIRKFAG